MCGRHNHGGYCCSQQPWQHAYCFVVNKGLPPWHHTITAPGDVSGHQGQLGLAGNLAHSQHAAIPGTGQGQSGLRDSGHLGRAPAVEALNAPEGRAESGTCGQGRLGADKVVLLLVMLSTLHMSLEMQVPWCKAKQMLGRRRVSGGEIGLRKACLLADVAPTHQESSSATALPFPIVVCKTVSAS